MLKASALYIVIIISTVIAIFSASLIATAYFYRLEYQKTLRYNRLHANLKSGIALALAEKYEADGENTISLFGQEEDSVSINKEYWGVFDALTVKSYKLTDTLKKAFLMAVKDSVDRAAIYLADEDRPLSVSGSTRITGDVYLPKAGIKQAYVEGKPYSGKELVYGAIKNSERKLPTLTQARLAEIKKWLSDSSGMEMKLRDSLSQSFYQPFALIRLPKKNASIEGRLSGKIIVVCDTTISIKRTASLRDIIIYAPAIVVEEGFRGSCQLFARDSIVAGKNCAFDYPSCMGVIKPEDSKIQAKVVLGGRTKFNGILFSWEGNRTELQTMVSLGKESYTSGEVYSSGYIKMEKPLTVEGKVSCNRFIIHTPTTLYENYLIDININRNKRSRYYLSSPLLNAKGDKSVLKWLE